MNLAELVELLHIPDLGDRLADVETSLSTALLGRHDSLIAPANRVLQGGGKRLRPTLAIAAGAIGEHWSWKVSAAAASVELVHVGSLVHDDIIDSAAARRGVPTINAVEGSSRALLVGDYLLARAGSLAASVSKDVAKALAETIADLCDGQSRETLDAFNLDRADGDMRASLAGKTASLMRCACEVGALAADLPDAEVKALAAYGAAFGMAFQLLDDVLDLVSTEALMGKPVGNDMREGVYTLPVIHTLAGDRGEELRSVLRRDPFDAASVDRAAKIVLSSGGIEHTLDEVVRANTEAIESLRSINDSPVVAGLRALPGAYAAWVLAAKAPGLELPADLLGALGRA